MTYAELSQDGQHIALTPQRDDLRLFIQRLRLLTPVMKPTDPPGGVLVPLCWPSLVQLAHTFNDDWDIGPRLSDWLRHEWVRRLPQPAPTLTLPTGRQPRDYQLEAASLIGRMGRVLLLDEAGTGKTISTILGLLVWADRHNAGQPATTLVVCPASVVDAWVEAWYTWAPHWSVVAWRGTPQKRQAMVGRADVYVMSYDTARVDGAIKHSGYTPLLAYLDHELLVADEFHYMKNPFTARTKTIRRLGKNVRGFVGLSGTPLAHNVGDVWSTLTVLEPLAWNSGERWVNRYCLVVPGEYKDEIVGLRPERSEEFYETLLGQYRRVTKQDVLPQLPPKIYSTRTVELPKAYRKAYDQLEDQMLAELPNGQELSVMDLLHQLTRLSQLASTAANVTVTVETDEKGIERTHQKVDLVYPSWKVDALLEILDERPNTSVLIFAASRQLIQLAGQKVVESGRTVGYIVGGQSAKERTRVVEDFQSGRVNVLCATVSAGGVGLTLTAASTVVFLQRPWSLIESLQAEDRAHRLGSERHDVIEIIDIVARDTIDTRVRTALKEKAGHLSELLKDPRIVRDLLGGKA